MSESYWSIEGIGIDTNDIRFNKTKLIAALREIFAEEEADELLSDPETFDLEDLLHGEVFDSKGEMLWALDTEEDGCYTYEDQGNYGTGDFYLVAKRYPWERIGKNEPTCEEDVIQHIIELVKRVSDMSAAEIRGCIYEIQTWGGG